jgi:hypothetical protein
MKNLFKLSLLTLLFFNSKVTMASHLGLFFNTLTKPSSNSYVGASLGVWSAPSNWSPAVVPNGIKAIANFNTLGGAGASPGVSLDISPTINQINMNGISSWYINPTGSNFLKFDGVSPSIKVNEPGITSFFAPITFNTDPSIYYSGNGNLAFAGQLTAVNKNINIYNNAGGTVRFSYASTQALSGGTLNLLSGSLIFSGGTIPLGGASGPSMTISNAGAVAPLFQTTAASMTMVNPIFFSDTGNLDFRIAALNYGSFTGAFTGNLTHNLVFVGGNFPSCTGLTFSGPGRAQFISSGNRIPVNFNPATIVYIGDGKTTANSINISSAGNFLSAIKHIPSTTISGVTNFDPLVSNTNINGNIVLNADGNGFPASIFRMGANGVAFNINGVISNGSSGSANVTVEIQGGNVILNGINTYTSPTSVNAYGGLMVNGSINSSVTVSGQSSVGGFLKGKGIINGFVNFITSNVSTILYSYFSAETDVLTVNGNVTMNALTKLHPYYVNGVMSTLQVNGNLNLASAAGNIVVIDNTTTPIAGVYDIIKFTGTRTGTLTPPTVPTGATITYTDTPGAGKVTLNIPFGNNF